jgi:hypothetical protein
LLFMNFGANRFVQADCFVEADRREFNVSAESPVRVIARPDSAGLQRGLDDMPRVHRNRTRHPDTMPTDETQPTASRPLARQSHLQYCFGRRHRSRNSFLLAAHAASRKPPVGANAWNETGLHRLPSRFAQSSASTREFVNRTS